MATQDTAQSTAPKYPTLTDDERTHVLALEAHLDDLEAQRAAITEQMTQVRATRRGVFEFAALRDVTPEQVALTYRTTGQGEADLATIVSGMHPYFYGVSRMGGFGNPMVLTTTLHLTGTRNDPAQIPSLAEALVDLAALVAPDGGLSFDPTTAKPHEIDWTWHEHADGMHPVDVIEDDLSEHRSLIVAHTADGSRAVLMDRRRWWGYISGDRPEGIVATGTLTDVLTALFHEVRENQPNRLNEDD